MSRTRYWLTLIYVATVIPGTILVMVLITAWLLGAWTEPKP